MSDEATGATPTPVAPAAPTVTVNNPAVATPSTGATPNQPTADTAAQIAELQEKLASANARIRELNTESKGHRLTAEQAKSLAEAEKAATEAYRKLGTPEELQAAKAERDALKQHTLVSDALSVLKLKDNAMSRFLLKDAPLSVEGTGDARKVMATVDGKAVPFEDYAKGRPELQEALPSLKADAAPINRGISIAPGQAAANAAATAQEGKAANVPRPRLF